VDFVIVDFVALDFVVVDFVVVDFVVVDSVVLPSNLDSTNSAGGCEAEVNYSNRINNGPTNDSFICIQSRLSDFS
jgi:hypothetical protein